MGIIKKRPKIRLRVPERIVPGEPFVARVEVLADRPVETQGVIVSLIGEVHGALGAGDTRVARTERFLALEAVPELGRRLLAGARAHDCTFRLPDDAPPAFEGLAGWVRYRVKVRVDIPWWPDARESFELAVRARPAPPEAGAPLRFSSSPGGPRGLDAYLEGSLSSNVVAPGEVLAGRLALGHVAHHRYRSVKVALVGVETVVVGRRRADTEVSRHGVEIDVSARAEGEAIPFSCHVPEVVGGFATPRLRLSWFLEVRAVIRLGTDVELRLPIVVTAASRERRERGRLRLAPPAVGGERLTEVWQRIAEEVGLGFEGERLAGHAAGALVVLRREVRGKEGTFLVGELRFAPLGLGLDVRPSSLLGALAGASGVRVKLGRDWDATHRAIARDAAQARAFLLPLAGALAPLVTEELRDDRARVVRKDGGREVQGLRAFAHDVLALAAGLGERREPVPPPTTFVAPGVLDSWQRLAARAEGRLASGVMCVENGTVAGARVRVSTVWEGGVAAGTVLAVEPPHRLVVPEGGFGAASVPPEVRRLVESLGPGLRIEASSIILTLPRVERDGDALWQRLSAMATLATRLRESAAGAYR